MKLQFQFHEIILLYDYECIIFIELVKYTFPNIISIYKIMAVYDY